MSPARRFFVFATVLATGMAMVACGGGANQGGPAAISPSVPAQASPSAPATTGEEPELQVFTDVLYQEDSDGTQYTLTVYAPGTEDGPWPVAVMIHGAGNFHLDSWARTVADQGVVAFVPYWEDRGFAPSAEENRAAISATADRLACAVRFARAEAERYGGDSSNLSLMGHSAGANYASVIAFADPEAPEGCVAGPGLARPDNLVLFEGDWLILGLHAWDRLLRQDRGVMDSITPWSYLEEADRIPVHILDSDDPALYRKARDADSWMALRDPSGIFLWQLVQLGAFNDDRVSEHEVQQFFYERLQALGYEATFHDLPDSVHEYLSDEALQMMAEAILGSQ